MRTVARRHLPTLAGAALGAAALGAAAPAVAAPPDPAADLLRRMRAPRGPRVASGPVWSATATGFAGVSTAEVPAGATGGRGGEVVVVRTAEELISEVAVPGLRVVLVEGTVELPPGTMVDVSSHTSVLGAGRGAEIVGGGLRLLEVQDVVIRNLTVRDSFLAADWDGKENDHDGIRVDTSDHVWIDHCTFQRLGDGQVDIRKDSTHVTVSWCVFRDHNKTLGVGWTDDAVTTLTLHHDRFSSTHQRNGSIDNVALGHVMNCHLSGASSYGMASRGASQLLVEHSHFEDVRNPIGASDDASRVAQRGNLRERCWGSWEDTGITGDPAAHYTLQPDPVEDVAALLARHAGALGTSDRAPRRIVVAQDGSGDVLSIHAAVGLAARSGRRTEIVVHPGTYREVVTLWPGTDGLALRGATGDPADVVVTYDKPASDWATVTVLSAEVTLSALTLENSYDPAVDGAREAYPLRSVDDTVDLVDVVLRGGPHEISDPRA